MKRLLLVLSFLVATTGFSSEPSLSSLLELIRADLSVERVAIVSEVMDLADDEVDGFWSVYRKYEDKMGDLWRARIDMIEQYTAALESLTPEVADEIATRALELETAKFAIKVEFYAKMKAATSANTALRFFQLENQLQAIAELQVASSLPFVPKRPTLE